MGGSASKADMSCGPEMKSASTWQAYDKTRPLVIDPTLVYATYFGSGGASQ